MTDSDTPFATDSGHNRPASGQILDRITPGHLIELGITRQLRKVVTKGKNLVPADCRELDSLNALTQVRRVITRRRLTAASGHLLARAWLAPADVRELIHDALDRLDPTHGEHRKVSELSDQSDVLLFHQTEVLRRLFGFTADTKGQSSTDRREVAIRYYARHANFRDRSVDPAKPDNFMKRICPDELFPPLIENLAEWENELRALASSGDHGLAWSQIGLAKAWESEFWRPLRIFEVLSDACLHVRLHYLAKLHSANDMGRGDAHASLAPIGELWRLAAAETANSQDSEDELDAGSKLVALFFNDFRNAFSFNVPDQGWLNDALDGKVPFWSPTDDPDGRGALALARYMVVFEPCSCPKTLDGLYEVMHGCEYEPVYEMRPIRIPIPPEMREFNQAYIEDIGIVQEFRDLLLSDNETSDVTILSLLCPVHMLFCWQQILRDTLRDAWWNGARSLVQMTMDLGADEIDAMLKYLV